MQYNVIIAGVGGQGILTIAQLMTQAAMQRGWHVKQSEVHGMSQRGGDVQSHVRFADHPVHSELIPLGEADLILAVEPLEALRYVEYLNTQTGAIVASSVPVTNISDYPQIKDVLDRIARFERHVILDAPKLAREAGSARAENVAMLGAASAFLPFEPDDLMAMIARTFSSKGEKIVQQNQRAFELGRREAMAQRAVLPGKGREQLFEHEVYQLLQSIGGVESPVHRFIPAGQPIDRADLAMFGSEELVVKLVSQQVIHKSDEGAVAIVPRSLEAVRSCVSEMLGRFDGRAEGVLLVEFIDHSHALGGELFVGLRWTREFGPVMAAGLGGVDTEYLAARLNPGATVAMAAAVDCSAEQFLQRFKQTAAYELISGQVRGHARSVEDDELKRCFAAFLEIARRFCSTEAGGRGLIEFEVNPFAIVDGRLIPLDGRGRLGELTRPAPPRPMKRISSLLEPRSIAVLGVSAKRANFGRIILNNIQASGFPADRLFVVKDDAGSIDGVPCVRSISDLSDPVDLLVAATGSEQLVEVVRGAIGDEHSGPKCSSVILISGGVGEKEGTGDLEHQLKEMIHQSRRRPDGGAVFLGANCMGARSRPGRYDTFFIPPHKLDPNRRATPRRVAIISQSGAFIITRMSNLKFVDPAIAVSLGNQIDVTVGDLMDAIAGRDDIDCIGVYVEGFTDLDGLNFIRAVHQARRSGKSVIFYKAGRSPAGRTAAQGHTASLAGDWDVCTAAVAQAGAMVATSFSEFEQLIELATDLHGKRIAGRRVAAVSNAGFETVGMADAMCGTGYEIEMVEFSEPTRTRLRRVLDEHHLVELVNPRNPLDLTPMAGDEAYEQAVRGMLNADEVDAVVVGCVPMTPQLLTTPDEIQKPGSVAVRLIKLFRESHKPLVFVVDSSTPYDALADTVRAAGVPVFRSADQAMSALGRWLCHSSGP